MIVVNPHLSHLLHKATGSTLAPELLSAAAKVVGLAGLNCFGKRLVIHHRHHQHITGMKVGRDTGNQSLGVKLRRQFVSFLHLQHAQARTKQRLGFG